MKKPQPRTVFFSEADEREHTSYVEMVRVHKAAGELYGSLEELADMFKGMLKRREVMVDFYEPNDRFRFIPGPMAPARGTA